MGFVALRDKRYLNLETFRKNGQGVKTPVWFAADPTREIASGEAQVFVYTIGNTGKVKRIRNDGRVRVAPCTARGQVTGDWVEARAQVVSGDEAARGMALLNKKYFPWKQILGLFAAFSRRERVVMAITSV